MQAELARLEALRDSAIERMRRAWEHGESRLKTGTTQTSCKNATCSTGRSTSYAAALISVNSRKLNTMAKSTLVSASRSETR